MRLDEVKVLHPELSDDDDHNSWAILCGRVTKTVLVNNPDFVSLNEKEHTIEVHPTRKS